MNFRSWVSFSFKTFKPFKSFQSFGLSVDAVKLLGVFAQDRFFIGKSEILAALDVLDLGAAGLGIETLVREVGGEDKGFVAGFSHRVAEAMIVAVEADEDSAGLHMAAKIFAGHYVGLRARQKFTIDIDLQMMRVGAVESVHEKRHPSRPALEKTDAQFWKAIEHPVGQHRGGLRHDAKGMAERVHRIVNADGVHPQVMERADVDRQGDV